MPNAQWTVPNAQSTVHWTLLTEWCLTSYIWVYDGRMKLGVVTFDQCEMTAIKWCLFSYRLHFNQISLNYTVANAQSTVPNAQPTVHWTLLTEWCLTSYISVYLCRMKLGIVTFDQCEMTAIKWCLFSYRLHFNQISLNYTGANAQSTVPNAQPTVHWTLLTEWCLTSYISVYDGRMKLGVEPLRSVWWQLSNDIYFVIDYILTRNC